jgi:hypothetical protein
MTIEVDADAGVARLALPGAITIPVEPTAAKTYISNGQAYVVASVGGREHTFVLSSGAGVSTVYASATANMHLTKVAGAAKVPSVNGDLRIQEKFVAEEVAAGGAKRPALTFLPIPAQKRNDSVGALGGDFLSPFHWYLDLESGKLVLAPRSKPQPAALEPGAPEAAAPPDAN